MQSATASVQTTRHVQTFVDRRLWVDHASTEDPQAELSFAWTWVSERDASTRVQEIVVLDADGGVTSTTTLDATDLTRAALDPVRIPPDELLVAGPGWSVESRLVADDVTVASCTVSQADWDAANQG
jgi:hypothetical protein